jgi:hypothetical protein
VVVMVVVVVVMVLLVVVVVMVVLVVVVVVVVMTMATVMLKKNVTTLIMSHDHDHHTPAGPLQKGTVSKYKTSSSAKTAPAAGTCSTLNYHLSCSATLFRADCRCSTIGPICSTNLGMRAFEMHWRITALQCICTSLLCNAFARHCGSPRALSPPRLPLSTAITLLLQEPSTSACRSCPCTNPLFPQFVFVTI